VAARRGHRDGVSVCPAAARRRLPKNHTGSVGLLLFIYPLRVVAVSDCQRYLAEGSVMDQKQMVPAQAGEVLAADADAVSLLWTADLRSKAQEAGFGLFEAELLRAEEGKANLQVYSAVTALLAAQSPTHGVTEMRDGRLVLASEDGPALDFHVRVQLVAWGWYSSVRVMVLEQYRTKRVGLTDNAYDKAWSRAVELVGEVLKGGFTPPASDNPDALKKAAQRAEAKVKADAARTELLAAFEGKSESDLKAALKAAYTKAAKGDAAGEAEAERIKTAITLRERTESDEHNKAVSDKWKAITQYSKRKVDGADNKLFVSDLRVLESVLELLQSQ